MHCPRIISFHNGVIEWTAELDSPLFSVKVNGETVSDGGDGFYRATALRIDEKSDAEIEITAVGRKSATAVLSYNSKQKKLALAPVSDYRVNGDVLEWSAVGECKYYRVYDLDFNAVTVGCTHYDMSARKLVWCVCPVPESDVLAEAEPCGVNIPYLDGGGTKSNPYLINTPFDLRAIDYYETVYALSGGGKKHYRIARDIDYRDVIAHDGESNIFTLNKPFFGTLDGDGNSLLYVRVRYNGGYWAVFDHIAPGGTVRNVTFEDADIYNTARDEMYPVNSSTAIVAYVNRGTVENVSLDGVRVTVSGGGACGIAVHNSGCVRGCTVRGVFVQDVTVRLGTASYEMSGMVLENRAGGVVESNHAVRVGLRGAADNIRAAAGCVSVNRDGGVVRGNSFDTVTANGIALGTECGGVVAYNSGTVERGGGPLGQLVANGQYVRDEIDCGGRGTLVGKNDGTVR